MTEHKVVTNDDIIAALPLDEQEAIKQETAKIVAKWGGVRKNAGRKSIVEGQVLKFVKKVTEQEANFIDYARKHHINYDDLMQG